MYKSLKIALQQNNVNFPKHWDQKMSVELFTTVDSEDTADELKVTAAVCKKWLKEIFPDKPVALSVNKYLRGILETIEVKQLEEYAQAPVATKSGLDFRKY